MSVPRPAIWVDTVTEFNLPASAMTRASSSSFLAFSTTAGTPALTSRSWSSSDSATSRVPTSTGWPVAWTDLMCSMTASILAAEVM